MYIRSNYNYDAEKIKLGHYFPRRGWTLIHGALCIKSSRSLLTPIASFPGLYIANSQNDIVLCSPGSPTLKSAASQLSMVTALRLGNAKKVASLHEKSGIYRITGYIQGCNFL